MITFIKVGTNKVKAKTTQCFLQLPRSQPEHPGPASAQGMPGQCARRSLLEPAPLVNIGLEAQVAIKGNVGVG